jgi:carbon storage regulator
MLVLSRKLGERILIGENIELTIVGFRGRTVVLGLEAPRDVVIRREELGRDEFGAGSSSSVSPSDEPARQFREEFDAESSGEHRGERLEEPFGAPINRRVFPVGRTALKGPLARSLASARPRA